MPKRTALTSEQIERRRSIDRAAQRNARAKTKARIRELEVLVDSLQASQGDERLHNVMHMLETQQDEARRLKGTLEAVRKLVGGASSSAAEGMGESEGEDAKPLGEGAGMLRGFGARRTNVGSVSMSMSASMRGDEATVGAGNSSASPRSAGSTYVNNVSPPQFALPDRRRGSPNAHASGAAGAAPRVPTWKSVNDALEKAVQHMRQEGLSAASDTDIAVRVVMEGWSMAKANRSMDLGWLILKQIDQCIFCDCSPATRLAILRAMRANLLKQVDSRHADSIAPAFYRQRYVGPGKPIGTTGLILLSPSQQMIRHPVLVDFFVWPDLRDHILLSPSLYTPDAFASRFSKNVHFLWPDSLSHLYTLDHFSGSYAYSPAFDARFQDTHCWTLGSDFFVQYPQLIGVVPMYNAMPPSLVLRIPNQGGVSGSAAQQSQVVEAFGDGMDAEGNMSAFHTFGEGGSWAGQGMFGMGQ